MAWQVKTFFVIAPTPVVVEDPLFSTTTSYPPGSTFQANENNASIRALLDESRIIEVTGADATQGFVLVPGQQGPTGLTGPTGPAGAGESNTTSSSGGTIALPLAKVGVDLPFRGLTAGSSITLTPSGTDVTIAATVPAPEDENNIIAQQIFR